MKDKREVGHRVVERIAVFVAASLLAGLTASCATSPREDQSSAPGVEASGASDGGSFGGGVGGARTQDAYSPGRSPSTAAETAPADARAAAPAPRVKRGTGVFVNAPTSMAAAEGGARRGAYTLNFERADLREVIETILGEILKQNYTIADGVSGVVTMRSNRPLSQEELLPVLDSLLQSNGAALVGGDTGYQVVPLNKVGSQLLPKQVGAGGGARPGYSMQVIPLSFVAAAEMEKIVTPLLSEGTSVKADPQRNLITVFGSQRTIENILETVSIFDVDWLRGMSLAMEPLQYADAKLVAEQLNNVLGEEGGAIKGVVRLLPIERLNTVLVISKQPRYLDEVSRLVRQFDQGHAAPAGTRRLYVYPLLHGKAEYIAALLQKIFGRDLSSGATDGTTGGRRESAFNRPRSTLGDRLTTSLAMTAPTSEMPAAPSPGGLPGTGVRPATLGTPAGNGPEGQSVKIDQVGAGETPVSIIPDVNNNSLLIMASPSEYQAVEAAVRRLDLRPRQVLIETIIAEVTLNGDLQYGVQWYLNGKLGRYDSITNLQGAVVNGALQIPSALGGPGQFSYSLSTGKGPKFLFELLNTESQVKFLSAPQVLVVDNQKATIKVGDSIPIIVGSSNNLAGQTILNETQYRDTGTLLTVTPHINAGGMVTLEVSQEVSAPGEAPEGTNPPILQRTVESTVAVQTGESIALGGLIRENRLTSHDGIPVLKDLPLLGTLFGTKGEQSTRTELIVTITPTVIEDQYKALETTRELRALMKSASDLEQTANRLARRPPS